jgi:hypothetical protein
VPGSETMTNIPKPLRLETRYSLREDGTGMWAVFDIFTGLTAEVNGVPQDGLGTETADDLVDLLNAEYIARRKGTTTH